jgi:uncharacterized protein
LKAGRKGSFNKILKGICILEDAGVNVVIRCNVDKTNIDYVDELIDLLQKENIKK